MSKPKHKCVKCGNPYNPAADLAKIKSPERAAASRRNGAKNKPRAFTLSQIKQDPKVRSVDNTGDSFRVDLVPGWAVEVGPDKFHTYYAFTLSRVEELLARAILCDCEICLRSGNGPSNP